MRGRTGRWKRCWANVAREWTVTDLVQPLLAETWDIRTRNSRVDQQPEASTRLMQTTQRSLVEARRVSATDWLTGLVNRRGLDQALQHARRPYPPR
jgi:PleD family two-component response regulator